MGFCVPGRKSKGKNVTGVVPGQILTVIISFYDSQTMRQKLCTSGLRKISVGQSRDRKLGDSNGVFMELKHCLQGLTKIIKSKFDVIILTSQIYFLVKCAKSQTNHSIGHSNGALIFKQFMLTRPYFEVQIFSPDPLQVHDHETKICK